MNSTPLENPALVAVWPGISGVAISAGYYMLAKLGMTLDSEFSPSELFEVDHVDVHEGLIHRAELPRSRLFVWKDPEGLQDLVLFLGDAQPPTGKFVFCRRLIKRAISLGVNRVFTFAAMATGMNTEDSCRVFGAATNAAAIEELENLQITRLQQGRIGGLNGVLLAAAAERDLSGICLLGETPHHLSNIIFPKASLAVLQAFTALTGVSMDLQELSSQAERIEEELRRAAAQVESALSELSEEAEGASHVEKKERVSKAAESDRRGLDEDDRRRIEALFEAAVEDRARAYELKRELDRLGVFETYEDRFLDLFKPRED